MQKMIINQNYKIFYSIIIVIFIVLLELLNLLNINIGPLGLIWPIPVLWLISAWQYKKINASRALLLCFFGIIIDLIMGLNLGTNVLIYYSTILMALAQRKFIIFASEGTYLEIFVISLYYILSLFIFAFLFGGFPNIIGISLQILSTILFYPKLYMFFSISEQE